MSKPTVHDYSELRLELQRLMAEPNQDQAAIDQVIHQLEQVQLQLKGSHGLQGNNPSE